MMRDLIEIKGLPEDVWSAIHDLYMRMGWEHDVGPYWTFEDTCALYMRLVFHRIVLPDPKARSVLNIIEHTIQHFLEDEVSTDTSSPKE